VIAPSFVFAVILFFKTKTCTLTHLISFLFKDHRTNAQTVKELRGGKGSDAHTASERRSFMENVSLKKMGTPYIYKEET
jgi:hypothetical protein